MLGSRKFLRWLGGSVYPAFVPVEGEGRAGAERYLGDLWRDAPRLVAAGNIALAGFVCVSPLFILGRPRLLPSLSEADRKRLLSRMMTSRFYLLRVAFQACKGSALIAILREPAARRSLLGEKWA